MSLSLALLLVAVASTDSSASAISSVRSEPRHDLGALIDDCDQIVRARVARVLDVPWPRPEGGEAGTLRLLQLDIEHVLWGDAATKSLAVIDVDPLRNLHAHAIPVVGERGVWFVERWSWTLTAAEKAALETCCADFAGPAGAQIVALQGHGRLGVERAGEHDTVCIAPSTFRLPSGVETHGEHNTAKSDVQWTRLDLAEFEAWIHREISARVPSLHAQIAGTRPGAAPEVLIARDGSISCSGPYNPTVATPAKLDANEMKQLFALVDEQRFFDLPATLGISPGPWSGWTKLRIRTEHGARAVLVELYAGARLGDDYTRLRKLWDAIPVARDWKIDGH